MRAPWAQSEHAYMYTTSKMQNVVTDGLDFSLAPQEAGQCQKNTAWRRSEFDPEPLQGVGSFCSEYRQREIQTSDLHWRAKVYHAVAAADWQCTRPPPSRE